MPWIKCSHWKVNRLLLEEEKKQSRKMFSWAGKSIFLASGVGLGEGKVFPSISEKHSPSCNVSLHQRLRSSVHPVGVAPAFSKKGGGGGGGERTMLKHLNR